MGTKQAPGVYSYLGKAEVDEPVFVLLGRDPIAPMLIRLWADAAQERGERRDKVAEAYALARSFEVYHEEFKHRPMNAIVEPEQDG